MNYGDCEGYQTWMKETEKEKAVCHQHIAVDAYYEKIQLKQQEKYRL